jgi:uncharacterized RDD family membrane protein YckC
MGKFKQTTMTEKTLRLVNFLIDTIIYFGLLTIGIMTLKNFIAIENVKWISCIFYFLYYFLFEYFSGQTIGKMLTKSKVISSTDNNDYFFIQIFIRTLTRFIPFDILSYLFMTRGLHDMFSKTSIISSRKKIIKS